MDHNVEECKDAKFVLENKCIQRQINSILVYISRTFLLKYMYVCVRVQKNREKR